MAQQPAPVPPASSGGDDWPAQAADTIVKVVGTVRDRTTGTAITAARAVVYGTLAAILGTLALVLFCVLLDRALVLAFDGLLELIDQGKPGRSVWMAHLVLGLSFVVAGRMLWKKAVTSPVD